MKIITDINELDYSDWRSFVFEHPEGNIFQTPEMYDLYDRTENHRPVLVAMLDSSGKMAGVLSGVVVSVSPLFGKWSARSIVTGGPLLDSNSLDRADMLLSAYEREVEGDVLFSQFRNINDLGRLDPFFSSVKYRREPHLDYRIDLTMSESELWDNLSSSCHNKISKSEREMLEIRTFLSDAEIRVAYDMLVEVYGRVKHPLPPLSLFLNARDILGDSVVYVGAFKENRMVAMRMLLVYKKVWYDWYAGSFRGQGQLSPNEILTWNILRMAKNAGAELFDFGGAGRPDIPYGVRDYKRKFGGKEVDFGRFERIYHPFLVRLAKWYVK